MGRDMQTARTIAVNTLIGMEVFYLFSMRYGYGASLTWRGALGTKPVLISLALVLVGQLMFIYAPFMQNIFDTQALKLNELLSILLTGVLVLVIIEIEKQVRLAFRRIKEG